MIEIYVGATQNNLTNMGGWGIVLIDEEGQRSSYKGCEAGENQMRMTLRAAIEERLSRRHVQAEYKARHQWLDEARLLAKDATGG